MDISSLISTQLSSIKNSDQNKDGKLEGVKKNDMSSEHKKVAEEMESLFAHQLIKTMRDTANALSEDKENSGNDTYMSMFDIEISKLFAKRGLGLQDSIIKWLERMPDSITANAKVNNND